MQRGFTLVELMITLAVGALLLAVGVPETVSFLMSNRLTTQTNDILVKASLARSEAMKRSSPVVVCTSSDGATCSDSLDWEGGWIAFIDGDNNNSANGSPGLAPTDVIFSITPPLPPGFKIDVTAGGAFSDRYSFLGNGLPVPIGGTVLICDARATTANWVGKRSVQITAGQISVVQPSSTTLCL